MSESSAGERTETATPRRRKEARERGQVRKSHEIISGLALVGLFGVLKILGSSMAANIRELLIMFLTGDISTVRELTTERVLVIWQSMIYSLAVVAGPIVLIALLIGVVGSVAQVGLMFSTKALAPKMNRLNPLSGLKRMFSFQALFEMFKAIAKVTAIGIVVYVKYEGYTAQFALGMRGGLMETFSYIYAAMMDVGLTLGFVQLAIGAIDFLYQWFKFEKDLKMTKYEVKMEYKQSEGDPQIKSRIRQKQREMAAMRMMQAVPDADVVITNPTHYAVALAYDNTAGSAPRVVAKGVDYVAQRIKAIALESNVQMVENVPLARSLYAMCEVGQEIPVDLYQAIAEILANIYRAKGNR